MLLLRKTVILSSKRCFGQEASKNLSKVGFIGVGQMGYRMTENLLKKGFNVTIFDKNNAIMKELSKKGAYPANDAKQCVTDADYVITMLPVGADLLNLYTPQLISAVNPQSVVIDSSTIEYTVSQELEKKFKAANKTFIDAPVSGGILGAEKATLTFMVGGDTKTINRVEPVLKAMGTNIYHCGSVGSGQIAKACNNLMLGLSMAGLSEALAIGIALGLDAKVLSNIINTSSGQCWSSSVYNPVPGILPQAPSSNDYKAGFSAQLIRKDLGIANLMAKNAGLDLDIAKITFNIYDTLCKKEMNEKDFSVVFKYISSKKK